MGWEACVDRASSALYAGMVAPQLGHGAPYYLRRLRRSHAWLQSLAIAVKGVSSFNLAAKQLEYGDPAEVGTAIRRRDRLALVDAPPTRSLGAPQCCSFGLPLAALAELTPG